MPRLHRLLLLSSTVAGLLAPLPAAPMAGDELLTALQGRLEEQKEVGDLVEGLDDLPPAELRVLEKQVEQVWPGQLEKYLASFSEEAEKLFGGSARASNNREVRTLRAEFMEVRDLGEGAMKKPLQEKSWPAMQRLRTILLPETKDVLEKASGELRAGRARLLLLAEFRNGLIEARVSLAPPYGEAELGASEGEIMAGFSELDRDGARTLKKNAELAEKEELPEAEARGLRELNEMRLLVGLSALVIDPKLCEAARGHSRDMQEHNFFSHTSPLKGKETPSKRAAEAGTSGGGENIYMGSTRPEDANRGWFFSPGHHKNMFRGNYRRVGLGNHGRHWTQMFGG